jgi:large subunit ribosomal protein L35
VPKMKTRKAAAKRFKINKNGKIFRLKAGKKHLLQHKSRTVKRGMGKRVEVSHSDRHKIRAMLGA